MQTCMHTAGLKVNTIKVNYICTYRVGGNYSYFVTKLRNILLLK